MFKMSGGSLIVTTPTSHSIPTTVRPMNPNPAQPHGNLNVSESPITKPLNNIEWVKFGDLYVLKGKSVWTKIHTLCSTPMKFTPHDKLDEFYSHALQKCI